MNSPNQSLHLERDPMPTMASSVVRELYRAKYDREDVVRFAYAVLELSRDPALDFAQAAE